MTTPLLKPGVTGTGKMGSITLESGKRTVITRFARRIGKTLVIAKEPRSFQIPMYVLNSTYIHAKDSKDFYDGKSYDQ